MNTYSINSQYTGYEPENWADSEEVREYFEKELDDHFGRIHIWLGDAYDNTKKLVKRIKKCRDRMHADSLTRDEDVVDFSNYIGFLFWASSKIGYRQFENPYDVIQELPFCIFRGLISDADVLNPVASYQIRSRLNPEMSERLRV